MRRNRLSIECDDGDEISYFSDPQSLIIHEDEYRGDSGLLDADGNPLGRVKPKIGFI